MFKHDTDKLQKHFELAKSSFVNKLYGDRQYPRFLMIERMTLQCEVKVQHRLKSFEFPRISSSNFH